jgi:hypothetical protein
VFGIFSFFLIVEMKGRFRSTGIDFYFSSSSPRDGGVCCEPTMKNDADEEGR